MAEINLNHFHFYDEIGRSKHSTVYKARRKSTVEYVAIKRVQKSQKERVDNEARILNKVDSANVVKFFNYFETTHHYWMVVEYCTGGTLRDLIKEDRRLPESIIQSFGLDMMAALQTLHSQHILVCDMKPSNVLLDEHNVLKLSNFGLARTVDLGGMPSPSTSPPPPPRKRGTPHYMAPELFRKDGVHSVASDLWGLGCVLYELFAGRPPFMSSSFQELVHAIMHEDVAALSGASPAFSDLVLSLLRKHPWDRPSWDALRTHHFWKVTLPGVAIADHGSYAALVTRMRSELGLDNNDHNNNNNDHNQPNAANPRRGDGSDGDGDGDGEESERAVAGRQNQTNWLDVLRLSRNVQRNARRKGEEEEEEEEEASDDDDAAALAAPAKLARKRDLPKHAFQRVKKVVRRTAAKPHDFVPRHDVELDFTSENEEDRNEREATSPRAEGKEARKRSVVRDQSQQQQQQQQQQQAPLPPAAGVADLPRLPAHAVVFRALPPLTDLLWVAADTTVRPIVGNAKVERAGDGGVCDQRALPFTAFAPDAVAAMPKSALEDLLADVFHSIDGEAELEEKLNTLAYFESLCSDLRLANVLVNSRVFDLLCEMLAHHDTHPSLNAHLCLVIGLLVRHATSITERPETAALVATLTRLLHNPDLVVRRRAIATLGELVFFIATLEVDHSVGVAPGAGWKIPNTTISALADLVRPHEDEVVLHYLGKTLENVASQAPHFAVAYATPQTLSSLVSVVSSLPRASACRESLLCVVCRLCRLLPSLVPGVVVALGRTAILHALDDKHTRNQRHALNLIALLAMESSEEAKRLLHIAPSNPLTALPQYLCKLMHSGSSTVRGKAVVCLVLVLRADPSYFVLCTNYKRFASSLDRIAGDRSSTVQSAVHLLVVTLAPIVSACTRMVVGELQAHAREAESNVRLLKSLLDLLHAVVRLLSLSSFRVDLFSAPLLESLRTLVLTHSSPLPAAVASRLRVVSFELLAAVVEQPAVLLEFPAAVVANCFPVLALILGSNDEDARLLALRLVFNCLTVYFNSEEGLSEEQFDSMCDVLEDQLLPPLALCLRDQYPARLLTLRLLSLIVEKDAEFVVVVSQPGVFFDGVMWNLLNPDTPQLWTQVAPLLLVQRMLESEEGGRVVSEEFCERLVAALAFAVGKAADSAAPSDVEEALECTLDLLNILLFSTRVHVDQSALILSTLRPLTTAIPTLIGLLNHDVDAIGDKAAYALVLLSHRFDVVYSELLRHDTEPMLVTLLRANRPALHKSLLRLFQRLAPDLSHFPDLSRAIARLAHADHDDVAKLAADIARR